jgi:hypothetical protein
MGAQTHEAQIETSIKIAERVIEVLEQVAS